MAKLEFTTVETAPNNWIRFLSRDGGSPMSLCIGNHALHTSKADADACQGANNLTARIVKANQS